MSCVLKGVWAVGRENVHVSDVNIFTPIGLRDAFSTDDGSWRGLWKKRCCRKLNTSLNLGHCLRYKKLHENYSVQKYPSIQYAGNNKEFRIWLRFLVIEVANMIELLLKGFLLYHSPMFKAWKVPKRPVEVTCDVTQHLVAHWTAVGTRANGSGMRTHTGQHSRLPCMHSLIFAWLVVHSIQKSYRNWWSTSNPDRQFSQSRIQWEFPFSNVPINQCLDHAEKMK